MALCDHLDALAAHVPDGASVAVSKEPLSPVALGRALIARGTRNLHLVTVPTGGYLADLLIGSGVVSSVETAGISLGEYGPAPQFNRAVREGRIALQDATCPAIYAALQAGEKGLPFLPLRGLLGSDLMAQRPDWKVIQNPMADTDDPIVVLPALRPDFALMHVPLADRFGNLWVGDDRALMTIAHAARGTLATAERLYDGNLMDDPVLSPSTIAAIYVTGVAEAPRGAWPTACPKPEGGAYYPADAAHMSDYARLARDDAAFAAYIATPQTEAAE